MSDEPDFTQSIEALSPMVAKLRRMQRQCRPFGSDYHAVAVSLAGLDQLAHDLTGQRSFYGAKGDAAGLVKRWEPRGEE